MKISPLFVAVVCVPLLTGLFTGCGGRASVGDGNREQVPTEVEVPKSKLVINEVVSSNRSLLKDEAGDAPDYIELYNSSDAAINLAGYGLSDDPDKPSQWTFGDVVIEPKQYLLVFASGKDVRSLQGQVPAPRQGLTGYVWSWADSAFDPPGGSTVLPDLFPGDLYGMLEGKTALSAKFHLADNGATLSWSAAFLHMSFVGWDGTTSFDASAYNQAYIEATLEQGARLELRLCVADSDCGEGYLVMLEGVGEPKHRYEIPLRGAEDGLDLAHLNGFEIRPVTVGVTTSLLVTDFVFSHGGYFLHTNFELKKGGEALVLSDAKGKVLDRYNTPLLKPDVSYGQSSAVSGARRVFSVPTPGAANSGPEYSGVCPPPTWDKPSGFYPEVFQVKAQSRQDCAVYYTLDGTTPTRDSTLAPDTLFVEGNALIRSVAAGAEWLESEVSTSSYFLNDAHDLAVVSLSTEPALLFDEVTGIYEKGPAANVEFPYKGANFWLDTEIPATVQFFEPSGKLGFEGLVGLSIFGNYSRGNDMKSLACHFRGQYGDSHLDYPLFPDRPELTRYDSFVLRNSGGDFGHTMIRDAFQSSLLDTMGLDYQAYRPTIVYINGQYWGIHNLREKLTADYFGTHYGWEKSDFDLLRPGEASAQVGNTKDWLALTERLETVGAASVENYAAVQAVVDIDNFIDYTCAQTYFGNSDWPGNNVKWYKHHGADGRFRWVTYDLDAGYQSASFDGLVQATTINDEWPNPEWSTLLLRKLLENPTFEARFISRCALRLHTNFGTNRAIERIDELSARIEPEIARFFTRWGLDPADHAVEVERLRSFARARPTFIYKSFAAFFGLPGTVTLTVDPGKGALSIDGVPFTGVPVTLTVFAGSPMQLEALPQAGGRFVAYSDGETSAQRSLTVTKDTSLALRFE